ncbi:hypothetical protein [Bacillus sp. 37MA]|uniref:hypothetical protein n=1 Tax=Bacillus sp. 37MA TaxID=1132442 RepID=UPI0003661E6D|nr:hypothetical protein [Bacillus sp. 37MA]
MSNKKKKHTAPETIQDILEAKTNRPTLDQTHTRRTFHIENVLLPILDELEAESTARGFKKEFINFAIRKALWEDFGINV